MNERIKELAEQAGLTTVADVYLMKKYMPNEVKFAQLIVEECVAQCEFVAGQAEITNTGEMARKTKATADSCAQMSKQHFGVEE